jgi:hypothetical protein
VHSDLGCRHGYRDGVHAPRATRLTLKRVVTALALLALAAGTAVLCYLALTGETRLATSDRARDEAGSGSAGESSTTPGATPTDDATLAPPSVTNQLEVDFATSPILPEGARTHDNGAVGSPLRVEGGYLTHDAPRGRLSVGSLEVRLTGPVQRLGARVAFPSTKGGDVVLVAWTSSLVDARRAGRAVPTSGLRLVASSQGWRLTTYDKGERILAKGTFDAAPGLQTFQLLRAGARAWVIDPQGLVTTVEDAGVDDLSGPWACWQLAEDGPGHSPARIKEVWAG